VPVLERSVKILVPKAFLADLVLPEMCVKLYTLNVRVIKSDAYLDQTCKHPDTNSRSPNVRIAACMVCYFSVLMPPPIICAVC